MRQIHVDSRDRSAGTSTNFTFPLPHTLHLESGHQGRIDSFRMPMVVPTINSLNNTLQVTMTGTVYNRAIEQENCFNGPHLEYLLRNQLGSIPGTWTITYSPHKTSLLISCSNAFDFTGGTFIQQLMSRPWYRPDGNSYYFEYVPLQGLDVAYLCCSQLSHSGNSVGPAGSSDVLCSIPIDAGYGAVQTFNMSSSVFFDLPAITTQQLSFQLRDRAYNLIISQANFSFTLTID